jgi:hypothetical protein
LFGIVLRQPTAHGAVDQVQVAAHLADTQALVAHHLDHVQFEGRIEVTSGGFFHEVPVSWGESSPIEVSEIIRPAHCLHLNKSHAHE